MPGMPKICNISAFVLRGTWYAKDKSVPSHVYCRHKSIETRSPLGQRYHSGSPNLLCSVSQILYEWKMHIRADAVPFFG